MYERIAEPHRGHVRRQVRSCVIPPRMTCQVLDASEPAAFSRIHNLLLSPARRLGRSGVVATEIVAGALLLLGLCARVAALVAIPTMLGAVYAHLAIGVWPNGPEREPPMALPIAVMVCAAYVVWRGAGRWSLDHRRYPVRG